MASKRRLRRRSCGVKVKYPSKEAALEHCPSSLHVYHCKFGDHWHRGRMPERIKRKIERRHGGE